jgi:AmmeMemoRadiSam system protein B
MSDNIRKAAVAGYFYPLDAAELSEQVTNLLNENKLDKNFNDVLGIIVPHAGYIYSGKSAAIAYNVLKENRDFETAIILSPSHHEYFSGISIFDGNFYQTPLGNIPINKELATEIVNVSKTITFSNKGHKKEHAIEVQLPFLQTIKRDFSIVPIVIGNQSTQFLQDLSNVLSQIVDGRVVIIVSSDLSHFHKKEKAFEMDKIVVDRINNMEFPELYNDLANNNCEACGGGGIVALLECADIIGEYKAEVLSHTDSGEVSNDNSSVVGYLSAVIFRN